MEQSRASTPVEMSIMGVPVGENQATLPRWQILEAELKVLDAQIDEATLTLGQNPDYEPHFERLEEVRGNLAESLGREPTRYEIIDALTDPLPAVMHAEVMGVLGLSDKQEELLTTLDAYKEEKYAALQDKVTAYEQRIDYEKVVKAALNDASNIEVYEAKFHPSISMRYRLRGDVSTTDYQGLLNLETLIDSDFATLQNDGLVKNCSEHVPSPEDTQKEIEFAAATESYVAEIERLQQAYRNPANRNEIHWKTMRTVLNLRQEYMRTYGVEESDVSALNAGQSLMLQSMGDALQDALDTVPAVDQNITIKSNAYKAFCEQARAIDAHAAVEAIEFTGMTPETDMFMTQDQIKEYLKTECIPLAASYTRKVVFAEIEQDEEKETVSLASNEWNEALGGSVITICPKQLKEDYEMALEVFKDDPEAHENALFYVQQQLRNTLRHEFSHTLHNVLPYAALKAWDAVTKADPTPVTRYIHRQRSTGKRSADIEDFADSTALFSRQPATLLMLSQLRYMTIENLYKDLYPNFDTSQLSRLFSVRFNVEHQALTKSGKDVMTHRAELLADITRPLKPSKS